MSTDPDARFPTAAAFRAALRGVSESTSPPVETPAFSLPSKLVVTGLPQKDEPSAADPWAHEARRSQGPVNERTPPALSLPLTDQPALELDRPTPAPIPEHREPPPPTSRAWLGVVLVIALLGGGGFIAWRTFLAPRDAMIDLAHAPPGTRLGLDGVPIVGTHLQLPISAEEHVLTVDVPHKPRRTIKFTAERDQTLELSP